MDISFCSVCGRWLRPEDGNPVILQGVPRIICDECKRPIESGNVIVEAQPALVLEPGILQT